MTKPIISVENLSKKYQISHQRKGAGAYTSLRDVIADAFANIGKKPKSPTQEDFWALKDVSFEVSQGERLGIIGRNGAGKSTLLKILSRITEPTQGRVTIRGRVASLLEVGTGFHPELSGRENIFLNGAILGMTRAEIKKKFDAIVDFAEVEQFLDTPVKRFSSGMYVRLAFAVAAHLEPEILLVDEVLAVGDVQFQKKCLGRMHDVSEKEGRTVLFVSHNMTAMRSLCKRGVLLENGKIAYHGAISSVIEKYLTSCDPSHKRTPLSERKRESFLSLQGKIVDLSIFSENGVNPMFMKSNKPFMVSMKIEAKNIMRAGIYLVIRDSNQVLISMDSGRLHRKIYEFKRGVWQIDCNVGPTFLSSGEYRVDCGLIIPDQQWIDYIQGAYKFTVRELDPYGSGYNLTPREALYHVDHAWSPARLIGDNYE